MEHVDPERGSRDVPQVITSKRWRRVEYERLVDVGAFEGEPLELIGGQLIVDRVVEVYREPGADVTAPFGWRYTSVERLRPPSAVTPLRVPAAPVPVAALLP
jgi:hypothetical protein